MSHSNPLDGPAARHLRPPGVDDATVQAVGRLTEALETVERARGRLYDFHQLTGEGDAKVGDAAAQLRAAGHGELADEIESVIVGRNVLPGRWTFQILEEYEETYMGVLRETESRVRAELMSGRSHVFESEMKESARTPGLPGHEAQPKS